MIIHDFSYDTESINIQFKCKKCGSDIQENIKVPFGYDFAVVQCSNCDCDEEYWYSIDSDDCLLEFNDFEGNFNILFENCFYNEFSEIKENIFMESWLAIDNMPYERWDREELYDDTTGETIYKIEAYKKNSSQAVVIDVWGCIMASKYRDEIINAIFNTKEKNWQIIFEFSDDDDKLPNKKFTKNPRLNEVYYYQKGKLVDGRTHIDILLCSQNVIIVNESKFTEDNDDICYCYKHNQCSGKYAIEEHIYQKKEHVVHFQERNILLIIGTLFQRFLILMISKIMILVLLKSTIK